LNPPVLDVDVHEAEVIVLEGTLSPYWLAGQGWWPTVQPLSLENAPNAVAVRMRQEVVTMKARSSRAKWVAWRRAQTTARSSSVAFQGSL
jgi:hypothetical protein